MRKYSWDKTQHTKEENQEEAERLWDSLADIPTRPCCGESCEGYEDSKSISPDGSGWGVDGWQDSDDCDCGGDYYLDQNWYDPDESEFVLLFAEGTSCESAIWGWFESTFDVIVGEL